MLKIKNLLKIIKDNFKSPVFVSAFSVVVLTFTCFVLLSPYKLEEMFTLKYIVLDDKLEQSSNVVVTDTIKHYEIDLTSLDSINNILYYEVVNNKLYLYTKQDSISDEIERFKYIQSLESTEE
jgi:hypothetical protein